MIFILSKWIIGGAFAYLFGSLIATKIYNKYVEGE